MRMTMRKIGRALAWISLLALTLTFGTWVQAGPSNTPLPTFSDASPALHVYTAVGVIKNNSLETVFICSNLDTVAVHIGVEVFDKDGVLANSDPNSGIAAGNGAILNVAAGATRTITTSGTVLLADDHQIALLPQLRNGSGRVVATSKTISCSALLVDEVHGIVSPLLCPTCPPPAVAHLPLIRVP